MLMIMVMTKTSLVTVPSPSLSMDLNSFSSGVSSPMNSAKESLPFHFSFKKSSSIGSIQTEQSGIITIPAVKVAVHLVEELLNLLPDCHLLPRSVARKNSPRKWNCLALYCRHFVIMSKSNNYGDTPSPLSPPRPQAHLCQNNI